MTETDLSPLLGHLAVGPLQANSYLLGAADGTSLVLVDPGAEADRLRSAIESSGRTLQAILLTHAHFDHVGALADLVEGYPVPVYLHPDDRLILEHARESAARWDIEIRQPPSDTEPLADRQRLDLAGLAIECLHTPGHAPGHIAFHLPEHHLVIAGDALFRGSIGRTDLPFGDSEQLLESIRRQLLTLPGETVVLPGHGPATTIGEEAVSNPFLS